MSAIDPTSIPVVIPKRVTSCQKALRVKRGLMRTCPPTMAAWYGIDFVRNDPFSQRGPKVMSAFALPRVEKHQLKAMFGERVRLLQPAEVAQFGIPTFPSRFVQRVWPPEPIPEPQP